MSRTSARTKAQLNAELELLNQRLAQLEASLDECQQTEAKLRESEERYQRITEALSAYIYSVRIEAGQVVQTRHSAACVAVTGYTREDFAANPDLWLEIVVEDDRPAVLKQARSLLDGQDAQPVEHRIIRKDGVTCWVRNTPIPHRDPQGRVSAYDGVIQDITERRQATTRLAQMQAVLSSAIELSPIPMAVASPDGAATIFNRACLEFLGIEDEGDLEAGTNIFTMQRSWQDLDADGRPIPPRETPLALALQGKATKGKEMKVRRKDGTERWEVVDGVPIYDNAGNLIAGFIIFPDITERKQALDELRMREAHQALVLDSLPMAFYVARPSKDYGGTWVSSQIDRICGFTAEQFTANPHLWVSRLHPDDLARVLSSFDNLLDSDSLKIEYRWQVADGGFLWLLDQAVLIRDESGDPKEIVGTWLDITERKRMEVALQENEAKMRSIFRAAPVGIGVVVKRVIMQANDHFCEMTGYSREELVGQSARIVYLSDEDYSYVGQEKYRQIGEYGTGSVETSWRRKDGTVIQVLLSSTPLNPDDLSAGVTFTALDITERKQAQEALSRERNLLRTLIDSMPDRIYAKDTEGRFTLKNEADARAMGAHSANEAIGKTDFDYYPRDNAERFFADDMQVIRSGQPLINHEELTVNAAGQARWILTTKVPLCDSQSKVIGLVGVGRDITDRKRAEQELHLTQFCVDRASIGIVRLGQDASIKSANDYFSQNLGYTREELSGMSLKDIDPTFSDEVWLRHRHDYSSTGSRSLETIHRRKDGTIFPVEITSTYLEYQDEDFTVSFVRDITEQKRAEEALRESEERYRIVSGLISDVTYAVRIEPDGTTVPEWVAGALTRITGFTLDELRAYGDWPALMHPDDMPLALHHLQVHLDGQPHVAEYRIIVKSGEVRWLRDYGFPVRDEAQGRVVRIIGAAQDITERKRAEEALSASEEKYRLLFQSNPVPMWVYDAESLAFLAVNDFAIDHYGYSREDFLHMTLKDIRPPEDVPYLFETLNKHTGELRKVGIVKHRRKDGSLIDVEVTGHEIEFERRQAMLILALDITERKRASDLLRAQRDLALALGVAGNLEDALRLCLETALRLSEMDSGGVYLVDEGSGDLKLVIHQGLSSEFVEKISYYHARSPHTQLVMAGEAIYTDYAHLGFPSDETRSRENLHAFAVIPIHHEGQVISSLNVASHTVIEVPSFARDALETISVQLGDVIVRMKAESELQLYRDHLEELVGQRTAELRAANEQLLVLTYAKDEFVSNVSHELHTPILSLKLRQYLLDKHPDQLAEHLSVIRRETDRLARTIEDLLQLSRLDQRRVEFQPVDVDLNELASQYVSDRLPLADSKGLGLSFEEEPGLPSVRADVSLIGQTLSILLTNAISYTPSGGQVLVRTHARHKEADRWVGFSVSDTGPGISPEEQRQLFIRFFRGGAGRNSGIPGTGLGLAIAQEIINRHGGFIEVESNAVPGHGATFRVWIPIGGKAND